MQFLKKFLGKIGQQNIAKKVSGVSGEANYGKFADGHKIPRNMARQLPEGDFKTFKDHPLGSKDNTKKFDDAKNGAKRAARNEKIWKAVKYGLPASLALGTVTQTLRSAESATRLQDAYRKKLEEEEEEEGSKKRFWQG